MYSTAVAAAPTHTSPLFTGPRGFSHPKHREFNLAIGNDGVRCLRCNRSTSTRNPRIIKRKYFAHKRFCLYKCASAVNENAIFVQIQPDAQRFCVDLAAYAAVCLCECESLPRCGTALFLVLVCKRSANVVLIFACKHFTELTEKGIFE